MINVIVDCYGGDNSPIAQVKGAVAALKANKELGVILVGKADELNELLKVEDFDEARLQVLNATEVVTCNDKPTEALKIKPDSSMNVAFELLRHDETTGGIVTSGSTGAALVGGIFKVGRIKGIRRPCLCPILPTMGDKKVLLVDCGANVDCKATDLQQFAVMGAIYCRELFGIEKPKVAILSNGTEDEKGCALSKEAFELVKTLDGIEFCGNMEARDIFSGEYDVIVSDGFYGNVALKSAEGAISLCLGTIKSEVKKSFWAKLGALFMKKAFKGVKAKIDYNKLGGAVLLGVNKAVVKAHGSAKEGTVEKSIIQAYELAKHNVPEKIAEDMKKAENVTE